MHIHLELQTATEVSIYYIFLWLCPHYVTERDWPRHSKRLPLAWMRSLIFLADTMIKRCLTSLTNSWHSGMGQCTELWRLHSPSHRVMCFRLFVCFQPDCIYNGSLIEGTFPLHMQHVLLLVCFLHQFFLLTKTNEKQEAMVIMGCWVNLSSNAIMSCSCKSVIWIWTETADRSIF